MFSSNNIQYIKYLSYVNSITSKRIKILIPVSIGLLIILMISDIFITKNLIAPYTRLLPFFLAIILLLIHCFKISIGNETLTLIYNIFITSIFVMMLLKFTVLFYFNHKYTNVIGIIISIFIMALEVRANLRNSVIIYFLPFFVFIFLFFLKYNSFFFKELYTSFIDIFIFLVIGFFINQVQNNFRFKTFKANYLLGLEKNKLKKSNDNLKVYQNSLESLVSEKTKELQNALVKAKESDKLKTAFLRNVSHEIRTPINIISGFLGLIGDKEEEFENKISIINENLKTLIVTVDNIIFLSKIQVKEKVEVRDKFKLKTFVEKTFKNLKEIILKSKKPIIPLLFFNKFDNVIVKTNEEYLTKAILLVVENAVKFTDEGEIKLSSYIKEEKVFFEVADTGQGVSEKNLENIFDSFRKFEDKNNIFRGVGIGLSITKKIVLLLNGEIKIKSKINKGTNVTIIIQKK